MKENSNNNEKPNFFRHNRINGRLASAMSFGKEEDMEFEFIVEKLLDVAYGAINRQIEANIEAIDEGGDLYNYIIYDFNKTPKNVKLEVIDRLLYNNYAVIMEMDSQEDADYVADLEALAEEDVYYHLALDDLFRSWQKFIVEFPPEYVKRED